jgi:hypothetical protein
MTRRECLYRGGRTAAALLLPLTPTFAASVQKPLPPRVFLEDPETLLAVRSRLKRGSDKNLEEAIVALRASADKALKQKPVSVMDKGVAPPSGDKHDYLSQGIYWWPDPSKPDGLPYIQKDGQINPEVRKITDESNLVALRRAIPSLAQGYYFTGDERYATHAALLLKTWFLNPETRMNPHFKYTQFIPGVAPEGRYIGIVDGESFVPIMDSIGLIADSSAWSAADHKGMEEWAGKFCDWLVTSEAGKKEGATKNNHGTVYDAIVVSTALFANKNELARKVLEEARQKRIAAQIEPDGTQPEELRRTKAWTYSNKNLMNLFWLASLGDRVDVNLWNYRSPDGRSLKGALDYLIPFALGEKPWPHKEINHKAGTPLRLSPSYLRRAAIKMREPKYEEMLAKLDPGFDRGTDALLWPRPIP